MRACATGNRRFLPIRESFDRNDVIKRPHRTYPGKYGSAHARLEVALGCSMGLLTDHDHVHLREMQEAVCREEKPVTPYADPSAVNRGLFL
jgi:hypothetical protein